MTVAIAAEKDMIAGTPPPQEEMAMTSELALMPVTELVAGFGSGAFSPVDALDAALARIAAHNGRVNAVCHLDEAGARAAAEASARRWAAGSALGPVDGVPLTVKDTLNVAGMPTRWGSLLSEDRAAAEDCAAVARLREGGAVILGKNTVPEYGTGPVTINPLTGVTRNPWNLDKTPGGSSGGAAAAVAAGFGATAVGTDAGGSIRIPAALCGLVGLKTTLGRVPVYPPMVVPVLSTTGSLARTVADAALLLNVLSRSDGRDHQELPADGTDYRAGLEDGVAGLRVAYSPTLGYAPKIDAEVAACVAAAARAFERLGAIVEEVDPGFEDPHDLLRRLVHVGVASRTRHAHARRGEMSDHLGQSVEAGLEASALDYLESMEARARMHVHMTAFHRSWDLLLTPTVAVPAFAADSWVPEGFEGFGRIRAWSPFCYPFSLSQQPAVSLPCGFSGDGRPVGLQIVAAKYRDALVLRAAHAYEAAHDWAARRPPL